MKTKKGRKNELTKRESLEQKYALKSSKVVDENNNSEIEEK